MGKISDRVSDSVISAAIDSYLTVARANTSELAETQDQRILPKQAVYETAVKAEGCQTYVPVGSVTKSKSSRSLYATFAKTSTHWSVWHTICSVGYILGQAWLHTRPRGNGKQRAEELLSVATVKNFVGREEGGYREVVEHCKRRRLECRALLAAYPLLEPAPKQS
jgi:hypothetical protein